MPRDYKLPENVVRRLRAAGRPAAKRYLQGFLLSDRTTPATREEVADDLKSLMDQVFPKKKGASRA